MDPQNPQPIGPVNPPSVPMTPIQPSVPSTLSTPAVPSSPAPEIPRKSSTLTTIAVVLLGVAVLALVAYFVGTKYLGSQKPTATPTAMASPTPSATTDPTANWKVYTNTTYGFSFRYPDKLSSTQGAVAAPYTGISKPLQSFSDPVTIREGTDAPFDGFSLYVVTDMKASIFEDYLNREKAAMDSSPGEFMRNAIRKDFEGGSAYISGNQGYYYLLSSDGKTVVAFAQIQQNETFRLTFDQILSTFKFLGSSPTPSAMPY